jgi:hypothetical protein
MDQAILVNFDIEKGRRVVDALDRAGYSPEVALLAILPQYENARLVLSASKINGLEELISRLRSEGILGGERPAIFWRDLNDPFIKELREKYAGEAGNLGHHLGSQYFGRQYVDEAYVYRIQ